jgi:hypothetical protein
MPNPMIFLNGRVLVFLVSTFYLLAILPEAQSQTYTTTGISTNWNSNDAWDCSGPGCNSKPGNSLDDVEVNILHDITFGTGSALNIFAATVNIGDRAVFTIDKNLFLKNSGSFLNINDATLINSKKIESKGTIGITNGFMRVQNFLKNEYQINLDNSCIELSNGNFANQGILTGEGNIRVLNGNASNQTAGNWSSDIGYCVSGNTSGSFPPSPLTCAEILEACACAEDPCAAENPNILPGFFQIESDLISPALVALALDSVNEELNDDLFVFDPAGLVLIDIDFIDYQGMLNILSNYATGPVVYNGELDLVKSNTYTVFFPVGSELIELDTTEAYKADIRLVTQASPSFRNDCVPLPTGSALPNQGDFGQETFFLRAGYNVKGTGQRIGILSDSWNKGGSGGSEASDILNGFLPGQGNDSFPTPVTVVKELPDNIGQGIDEGRAMAQIVHSVAPGAELYFHTAFEGPGKMAEAILSLANDYTCQTIVDDITLPTAPFFQGGLVGDAIEQVVPQGVLYFTSAVNYSDRAYTSNFNDGGSGFHDFGYGTLQPVSLGLGEYLVILQWEDDFYSLQEGTGAQFDFDIFLADDNGNPIYSFNRDNTGGNPVEILPFFVTAATQTNIQIKMQSGLTSASPKLKYIVYKNGNPDDIGFTPLNNTGWGTGTITGHAIVPEAITAAAVRYDNTPFFGGTIQTQGFSSRGDASLNKPDFAFINGGNISFNLGNRPDNGDYSGDCDNLSNFFGTSSSAPHGAAMAVLFLEMADKFNIPGFDVRTEMANSAIAYSTSIEHGAGYVSAFDVVSDFVNPAPNILQFNLDSLSSDTTGGGTLVIEGEYFVEGQTQVFFRDQELTPSSITDTSITVIIPPFQGNPPIIVINNAQADGDGGVDTGFISDPVFIEIFLTVDTISKRWAEELPAFSFTATPALSETELSLLEPFVSYNTSADDTTDVGDGRVIELILDRENLPPELTELYTFTEVDGFLIIDKMEMNITPKEIQISYGGKIRDQFDYDLTFGTAENPANIAAPVLDLITMEVLDNYRSSQAPDLLVLTDISLSDQSLSNISLSDISLSDISLSDISLSDVANLLDNRSFIASANAIWNLSSINISLSDISLSDISLSDISLSDISLSDISLSDVTSGQVNISLSDVSGAVPLDISHFELANQWNTGGSEYGDVYTNISLSDISLSDISLSDISLSDFISLSDAAVTPGTNSVGGTLANISLSDISLSDFISLSDISLSDISLSDISLSDFISLSDISLSDFISLSDVADQDFTNISLSDGTIVPDYPNINGFRNFISLSDADNTGIISIFSKLDEATFPISLFPINFISGLGVGSQVTAPATFVSDRFSRNVIVTYSTGNADIEPSEIDVQVIDTIITYGDTLPNFRVSVTGLKFIDNVNNILAGFEVYEQGTAIPYDGSAGVYDVVAMIDNNNYTLSTGSNTVGTFTVLPRSVDLLIADEDITYGQDEPTYVATVTNLAEGDTDSDIYSGLSAPGYAGNAGTYDIVPTLVVNSNYAVSVVTGTLTVNAAALTITADDKSKDYGATLPALSVSYSGLVNGDTQPATAPSVTTTATSSSDVGSYPITASGAADENYSISYVEGTLTVNPVELTITAEDKSKDYGAALPVLTVSYSGLVNGDTQPATSPSVSTTATSSSVVGTYPVTASGAIDENYTISYVEGMLTVNPVSLTITADDNSKDYGADLPALTVSYAGLVNGDTQAATPPSASTAATSSSAVGTYPITASGAIDANYNISYVEGTLTVNPVSLTITADDKSKDYGADLPALTVSYAGLVNGDTQTATPPTVSTAATSSSAVGVYPITASGAIDANYTISYVEGTLTVNPVSLTITADDQSKDYGAALPALSVSYAGLVNGDTQPATAPSVTTTATSSSDVDSYPITASGAADENYSISYIDGTMSITTRAVAISIDNNVIGEGDDEPAYTAVVTNLPPGFDNSDVYASLVANGYEPDRLVGQYDIVPIGISGNYNVTAVDTGTLYVNPVVGCNNKIKASDLCKIDLATPIEINGIIYDRILRFEYTNLNAVSIFIPFGPDNYFKGKGNNEPEYEPVGPAVPPELFLPGVHTFDLYSNGTDIQWVVKTMGCNNSSKSSNGSNANPCPGGAGGASMSIGFNGEVMQDETIRLYPNPVRNLLTIEMGENLPDSEVEIQVLDITGRTIHVEMTELVRGLKYELNMSQILSGVYFIHVRGESTEEVHKVIVE